MLSSYNCAKRWITVGVPDSGVPQMDDADNRAAQFQHV